MSFTSILIHAVFSTKNREILIPTEEKNLLCAHILDVSYAKSIQLLEINGHLDHLHCLISLRPAQSLADVMQSIKGESAYWFNNKSGLAGLGKLVWQDDYFAVSVSKSHIEKLRSYIQNQEQHHQQMTYYQEIMRMAEKYGSELKLDDLHLRPSAKADGNK
jgi:putative transposase